MATGIRGTSNFNVPQTQNTAPVLEFRCLYTHDIRKKQKKWHDGSLRFHTFNRRVMVYDDVKNYIGDLHYRQGEEFGEGVELQLDRPVLVEVGEPIGETQTDLAPLLDRGRAEREGRPAMASSPQRLFPRKTNTINNGRPKSLADVLGPSQGRIGRARLPLQSPYEQRQIQNIVLPEAPPMKKQRLIGGKENHQPAAGKAVHPADIMTGRNRNPRVGPTSVSRSNTEAAAKQSIDLTLDDSDLMPRISSEETPKSVGPQPSSSRSKPKCPTKARKKQSTNMSVQTSADVRLNPRAIEGRKSSISVEKPRPNSSQSETTGRKITMARLRLRAQSPRKKLIYRALLPNAIAESIPAVAPQATPSSPDGRSRASSTPPSPSDYRQEESHWPPDDSPARNGVQNALLISSSPMFVSQDLSEISPRSQNAVEDRGMDFILTQSDHEVEVSVDVASHANNHVPVGKPAESPECPSSPSSPIIAELLDDGSLSSPKETAQVADTIGMTGSTLSPNEQSATAQLSAPPLRPLRRAVSDNISDITTTSGRDSFGAQQKDTLGSSGRMTKAMEPPQKITSPRAVQRAQSDSVALAQMKMASPIMPRPSQLAQPKRDDQGAWTQLEAFLLFERWPAEKAHLKPTVDHLRIQQAGDDDHDAPEDFDYYDGIDEHIDLSMDASMRPKARALRDGLAARPGAVSALPGIRSARAVLRDEI